MSERANRFIRIEIEPDLDEIEKQLGKLSSKAPVVLKKALNDTAKWTGKMMAKDAQERYQVKTMKFAKEFKLTRATNGHLEAVLTTKGEPLSASKFKTTPTKPQPSKNGSPTAKLGVRKGGMKSFRGRGGASPFITTFESGHIAMVQRYTGESYASKGWKERKHRWKKYLKRTGKLDKTRIKELMGPSVPKMMEKTGMDEQYFASNHSKIMDHLKEAVQKHINTEIYFANKGRK